MRYVLSVPDLGLDRAPVVVSLWLVRKGEAVVKGDPLVELLAGEVLVDLPSPASGVLTKRFAAEEEEVLPGRRLAVVESDDEDEESADDASF